MTPLFSETGSRRLDEIVQQGLICVFDFDGTLSPIVAEPEHASLPPEVLQRLVELSGHVPIAIITGRSVSDIRARLNFEPDFIVGNHGIEGMPGWELRSEDYEQLCRAWKDSLSLALQDSARFDPNIAIEDKRYSLSVHYRMTADPAKTESALLELFSSLVPLPRLIAGKYVFNLLPLDAADKGNAMEQLMRASGARTAIYIGDDVTDEDVFKLGRSDILSVRVECGADSAAEFFLPHWLDILRFLDELIRRLRAVQNKDAAAAASTDNT